MVHHLGKIDETSQDLPTKREIIYLAAPYTSPDGNIRKDRYSKVTLAGAQLASMGWVVFSPITMTHPMDELLSHSGTLGSRFWTAYDEPFMAVCSALFVLCLDGWNESSGVAHEIAYFEEKGQPIYYITPGLFSDTLLCNRSQSRCKN